MKDSQATQGEGEKILLVEDDPEQLKILQAVLGAYDFHCVSFLSAEEALDNCEPSLLAAAIIDLDLPGMDGIELGGRLKEKIPTNAFLPIIMVSGTAAMEERVRAFRSGCDDFLSKPINHFELSARLRGLVDRRRQQAELLRVNEDLHREQDKRRELAALIVHDLRNPLTAILGNTMLIQEVGADDPELRGQCLGDLETLCNRALSMVEGLLDVEELEEGILEAERSEVEVGEFARRFPHFYDAAVRVRSLELVVEVEEELVARFDRQLIGRVVENLLDNSVRYAPRRGLVALRARCDGDALVIEVGNSGPAIPLAERAKIFERYYRLEGRRSDARTNRGLGLYFCRLAVESHGGSIEVTSTDELPACFVLRLPNSVVRSDEASQTAL
jgi:signal transduction histidine kinase